MSDHLPRPYDPQSVDMIDRSQPLTEAELRSWLALPIEIGLDRYEVESLLRSIRKLQDALSGLALVASALTSDESTAEIRENIVVSMRALNEMMRARLNRAEISD